MLQIIEEVEVRYLTTIECELIYALVGKKTKKLLGFKIKNTTDGKIRQVHFSDIARMKQILEEM
jgi:hypothetical protein